MIANSADDICIMVRLLWLKLHVTEHVSGMLRFEFNKKFYDMNRWNDNSCETIKMTCNQSSSLKNVNAFVISNYLIVVYTYVEFK